MKVKLFTYDVYHFLHWKLFSQNELQGLSNLRIGKSCVKVWLSVSGPKIYQLSVWFVTELAHKKCSNHLLIMLDASVQRYGEISFVKSISVSIIATFFTVKMIETFSWNEKRILLVVTIKKWINKLAATHDLSSWLLWA